MERFMSILIEHYAGNFPVWIAPIQAMILPISDKQIEYAKKLEDEFTQAGYRVQIDNRSEKINRKIADAETKKNSNSIYCWAKRSGFRKHILRIHGKGD
jgi:threonyl-tRNA synthetase